MNNKELQMTTTMPLMKKSLLALAVAGTMAMSGGAYAAGVATTVTVTDDTTAGTVAGDSTAITAPGVVLTVTDGNATNDANVAANAAADVAIQTVSAITISDATAVAASVGAINLNGVDSITIINDNDAGAQTLAIGAVTGTGTLIVSGTAGDVSSAFTVNGSTLGTSSVALAEVEVIGGVGHATANNAATLTTTSTLNTTLLTLTGGAAINDVAATANGNAATATIGGNATIGGGGIVLTGGAANAGSDEEGGAATLTLSGTTTITGGAVTVNGGAGADNEVGGASAITFTGAVTSDSALTLTSGTTSTGLGGAATATFSGDATFSAISLNVVGTGTAAGLTFNGTGAQTVTGAITAESDDEGTITVSNTHASGVTFASSIGGAAADGGDDVDTLTIGTTTAGSVATFNSAVFVTDAILIGIETDETAADTTVGSSATFKSTVTGGGFTMGADDEDVKTNNLTFDATSASFTATGAIAGGHADDVNTVTVTGGASGAVKTVTFATDMGANIDTLAIGDNTTLASATATTAGAITLGSGGTLKTAADTTTITGTIDGTSAGNGTLDVDHTVTAVVGSIGATASIAAVDVATGKVLTTNSAVIKASTITLAGAASELNTLTTASTITGNIVAGGDGVGVLDVDIGTTIVGNVGSSTSLDLATANVADTMGLTVSGNYYVAATTLDGVASSLTLNGTTAQTVSGTIDAAVALDGDVYIGDGTLASSVTFNSALGASTAINLFDVKAAATANVNKNITFQTAAADDTVGLLVNGTLNISSADNTVALNASTDGTIDINGTVGITGANNVTLTSVDDSATADINIDGTLTTLLTGTTKTVTLTADGDVKIGAVADTTINAGNTIVIGNTTALGVTGKSTTLNIKKTADFAPDTMDVISADGVVTHATASTLNVGLASDTLPIANNATIKVIDSGATVVAPGGTHTYTALIANGRVVLTDTALIDIQHDTTGTVAEDLDIKVVHKTSVDGVTGQNNSALVNALKSATAAANATEFGLLTALTSTQTEDAAEKSQPDSGAANGAALASVSGANTVIAGRQANTRVAFNTLGTQSGVSTGDDANDAVVWAQIFGSTATQDKVGAIDGYDADSNGLALGWETDKSGDLMGLSVSYSDADVDGKSASASHTDTTAVQVAAYGTYGKATDWMVGYASADNDTKRTTLNGTASGKYDSNIFTAKVGHAFDSSNTGTWTMTPKVDATYTNIDNDGYTETGAGNFNLIVASSSNDILTARAGAEFSQRIVDGDAVTIPHINVMAGYDLKNDGAETSSTFTGGGAAFTTKGADPEKASLQLGFGVDHVSDDSTVSLNFNADLRSDYDSMSGDITFKSKF